MAETRRVYEPCPRCGDDSDVLRFENAAETDCVCEMCGCVWVKIQQG